MYTGISSSIVATIVVTTAIGNGKYKKRIKKAEKKKAADPSTVLFFNPNICILPYLLPTSAERESEMETTRTAGIYISDLKNAIVIAIPIPSSIGPYIIPLRSLCLCALLVTWEKKLKERPKVRMSSEMRYMTTIARRITAVRISLNLAIKGTTQPPKCTTLRNNSLLQLNLLIDIFLGSFSWGMM